MREHMGLFRGKRIGNGEWVEGTPFFACGCCKMITAMAVHLEFVDEGNVYYAEGYPVDPDTVGECTGLRDKSGKLIFEGDIVTFRTRVGCFFYPMYVRWYEEESRFIVTQSDGVRSYPMYKSWEYEIIGNIHDNPELLKGGEGDG